MTSVAEDRELIEEIRARKKALGEDLLILTHHYQRKEIVDLGDFRGDSFGLSQKAAAHQTARFIVFCGVHFMAESAEILSRPQQTVQIPAVEAGCWMADMADTIKVTDAWEALTSVTGRGSVVPVVYMNSGADLKAFCGKEGGVVCTSSNARAAFGWALEKRKKVFFFPDQHLGRNTANQMGISAEAMILWDPEEPLGGNTPEGIKAAKVILWDGYCLVHTRFRTEHIERMRVRYPEALIVVHPECTEEVVDLADAVGSTSFIVKYVEDTPRDRPVIVGTEINLVNRLAMEHPDKTILDLHFSLCPNMFKINLQNLLWSLENVGKANVIRVPEAVKADARLALERMLALTP